MALYIVTKDKKEHEWYVGYAAFQLPTQVDFIQADGHELEYIQTQYWSRETGYNIPMPNNQRVIQWFGDLAKTIVSNL